MASKQDSDADTTDTDKETLSSSDPQPLPPLHDQQDLADGQDSLSSLPGEASATGSTPASVETRTIALQTPPVSEPDATLPELVPATQGSVTEAENLLGAMSLTSPEKEREDEQQTQKGPPHGQKTALSSSPTSKGAAARNAMKTASPVKGKDGGQAGPEGASGTSASSSQNSAAVDAFQVSGIHRSRLALKTSMWLWEDAASGQPRLQTIEEEVAELSDYYYDSDEYYPLFPLPSPRDANDCLRMYGDCMSRVADTLSHVAESSCCQDHLEVHQLLRLASMDIDDAEDCIGECRSLLRRTRTPKTATTTSTTIPDIAKVLKDSGHQIASVNLKLSMKMMEVEEAIRAQGGADPDLCTAVARCGWDRKKGKKRRTCRH